MLGLVIIIESDRASRMTPRYQTRYTRAFSSFVIRGHYPARTYLQSSTFLSFRFLELCAFANFCSTDTIFSSSLPFMILFSHWQSNKFLLYYKPTSYCQLVDLTNYKQNDQLLSAIESNCNYHYILLNYQLLNTHLAELTLQKEGHN